MIRADDLAIDLLEWSLTMLLASGVAWVADPSSILVEWFQLAAIAGVGASMILLVLDVSGVLLASLAVLAVPILLDVPHLALPALAIVVGIEAVPGGIDA